MKFVLLFNKLKNSGFPIPFIIYEFFTFDMLRYHLGVSKIKKKSVGLGPPSPLLGLCPGPLPQLVGPLHGPCYFARVKKTPSRRFAPRAK